MTLRDQLGKPVLFHWVGWHGKDGTPSIPGYISTDPLTIGDQLTAMEALGGPGFGVVALTYGPTVSSFIHQASMEMCQQCNERGVPFALCYDPWTVRGKDVNSAMSAALQHPDTQAMLNSRSYLTGKPVLDFATGCDPKVILNNVHGIEYWMQGVDYSWPDASDASLMLSRLKTTQSNPNMKLPCVMLSFDDGTGADRNKSVWNQTKPVRIIPSLAGSTFWSMKALAGVSDFIQVVTWNDYAEQTAVEPLGAILSGGIHG